MKILLDENLPRKLVAALRAQGHEVESVHTLRMQGLDNGRLYQFAREKFELSRVTPGSPTTCGKVRRRPASSCCT